MKPVFKTAIISLGSAIVGASIAYGAFKYTSDLATTNYNEVHPLYQDLLKQQEEMQSKLDELFESDLFKSSGLFDSQKSLLNGGLQTWFVNKFKVDLTGDISKREDENFVYYDIKVEDPIATRIDTKVENGYVTISGRIEKNDHSSHANNGSSSYIMSTFNKTFPLPANIAENKMKIVAEENKIVLKFPKNKV